MMRKSKDLYCTLFFPKHCKHCAGSDAAPNSASAATIPPMRRMTVILSPRPRVRPPRAPGRRPTGARADRTPAIPDEKRAPRNPRSRAAPTAPGPVLPRDAARCRAARARSSSVPPSPARARPRSPTRSRKNPPRPSGHGARAPSGRSLYGRRARQSPRRDRAVQLVLVPDLDGEAEADLGDAAGLGLGGALLVGALAGDARRFVRDLFLVGLGSEVGEPLRQQVVAGVAVLHLHHVARGAQVLHVFTQDHFHGSCSSMTRKRFRPAWRAARGRSPHDSARRARGRRASRARATPASRRRAAVP